MLSLPTLYSNNGDMGMHFFGYRNAAKVLKEWIGQNRGDNGTIYPLIFLIRHTIELGLKESIRRACKLGVNHFLYLKKNW